MPCDELRHIPRRLLYTGVGAASPGRRTGRDGPRSGPGNMSRGAEILGLLRSPSRREAAYLGPVLAEIAEVWTLQRQLPSAAPEG